MPERDPEAEALANLLLLLELCGCLEPGPDQREERAAIERSVGLVRTFSHSLLGIIREATAAV
jgi:hypothetical protein